jgi:hypothetical protein
MRKKLLLGLVGAAFSAFLLSCPLEIPTKVQLVASPAVYLPLGSPEDLENLDFDLSALANLNAASFSGGSGNFDVRDYPGQYPDVMAFAAIVQLANYDFTLPPQADTLPPSTPILINIPPIAGGPESIPVSDLMAPLSNYSVLKFRSVPAYIYISGPAGLFAGGNVNVELKVTPDGGANSGTTYPLPNSHVDNLSLPVIPPAGEDIVETLRPLPRAIAMEDYFNDRPDKLEFTYEITVGPTTVPLSDLLATAKLEAYLVLVMPLQFITDAEMPIIIDDDPLLTSDEKRRITISSTGLFPDSGSSDLIDQMEYLSLEANVKNNLGLSGVLKLFTEDPSPVTAVSLGSINLSGQSRIRISREQIQNYDPFKLWGEIWLLADQLIDIKRIPDAATNPLEITLGATLKTQVNQTF